MPKRADRVSAALIRARLALRRGEDAFLAQLIEQAVVHRAATIASGLPRTSAPPPDKRVVKAVEFIHANLSDRRITLSSVAAAAGVSPFHFARLFADAMGQPPRAYLRRRRLQLAREMLAHRQSMSIANVALAAGFGTQAHLTSAFKAHYGLSPGAYRKQAGQARERR